MFDGIDDDGTMTGYLARQEPGRAPKDLEAAAAVCESLPSVPGILVELQDALRRGETDARHIAKLVQSDPALVAQILRVVNSSYYGVARRICDVTLAVAYLGFNQVYRVVLTVSVVEALDIEDRAELHDFWRHSYFTALTSKYLASVYERQLDPGELWPAALLHDIGRLVYLKLFPLDYKRLRAHQRAHACPIHVAEEALDLPSHAALGAELCRRWNLPLAIEDVCEHHHTPDGPRRTGLTGDMLAARRLIAAANILTDLLGETLSAEHKAHMQQTACGLLGASEGDFVMLMGELYALRDEVDSFAADIT